MMTALTTHLGLLRKSWILVPQKISNFDLTVDKSFFSPRALDKKLLSNYVYTTFKISQAKIVPTIKRYIDANLYHYQSQNF